MKKVISLFVLAVSLMGSYAVAEDVAVLDPSIANVLRVPCDDDTPVPARLGTVEDPYCSDNGYLACPGLFELKPKYCWGGFDRWWYRCGYQCELPPELYAGDGNGGVGNGSAE